MAWNKIKPYLEHIQLHYTNIKQKHTIILEKKVLFYLNAKKNNSSN
jgi:hypothetical protein